MEKATRKELVDYVLVSIERGMPASFTRSGRRFITRSEHAIGLINIQTTTFGWSPGRLYATAELGVWFRPIALRYDEPTSGSPGIADCHLRCRIGLLLPYGNDHWWNLAGDVDDEPLPWLASGGPSGLVDAVLIVGFPKLAEFMQPLRAVEWWIGMQDGYLGEEQALAYSAIVASTVPGGEAALPRLADLIDAASELDADSRRLLHALIHRQQHR